MPWLNELFVLETLVSEESVELFVTDTVAITVPETGAGASGQFQTNTELSVSVPGVPPFCVNAIVPPFKTPPSKL